MSTSDAAAYCQAARQNLTSGAYDQAIGQLQAAIGRDPRFFEAYELLGWAYLQRGQTEPAVQALSTAVGLQPSYHPVRINLAHALERLGRPADATAHLQHVLLQDPANTQAQQALAAVRSRMGSQSPQYSQPTPGFGGGSPYSAPGSQGYSRPGAGPGYASGATPYRPYPQPTSGDYFSADTKGWSPANIGAVLTRPAEFFREQSTVRGFLQPLVFYVLLSLPALAINGYSTTATNPRFGSAMMIPLVAIVAVLLLMLFFGLAGFYHLFSMMFGAKGGYEGTFRAMVYTSTPYWLFGFLGGLITAFAPSARAIGSLVVLCGAFWGFVLLVVAIREIHGLSTGAAFGAAAIPSAIIVAVLVLLTITLIAGSAAVMMQNQSPGSTGLPISGFPTSTPQFPGGSGRL